MKGCPQQTTVGEALGVKGRNPIESVRYKRKVTMAEEEEKKHGREKKHRRKTQWGGGT